MNARVLLLLQSTQQKLCMIVERMTQELVILLYLHTHNAVYGRWCYSSVPFWGD